MRQRIKEMLGGGQSSGERVPVFKPADCLGEACIYFDADGCKSRLELLEASGKSGGNDLGPYVSDSSYALYGHVCTGGTENVVVDLQAESPNGTASTMELMQRMGRVGSHRIVLTPRS